jgi:hypothetical protein
VGNAEKVQRRHKKNAKGKATVRGTDFILFSLSKTGKDGEGVRMAERTYTLDMGETAATLPPAPLRSARSEDRVLQFCRSLGCLSGKRVGGRNKLGESFKVSEFQGFKEKIDALRNPSLRQL